jgi:hypothetical protein
MHCRAASAPLGAGPIAAVSKEDSKHTKPDCQFFYFFIFNTSLPSGVV